MKPHRSRGLFALPLLLSLACGTEPPAVAESGAAEVAERAIEALAFPTAAEGPTEPARAEAYTHAELATLIERLSEPDGEFFSDNFISNETSYLQIADLLPEVVEKGGVYLGVGPEQNFSYLALTEPDLAFIIDIRRDNLVLHLLYKAIFDLADDRASFLALLTGREPAEGVRDADLEGIFDAVQALPHSEASHREAHRRILERIEGYGIELDDRDRRSLATAHRTFFKGGVDIRFALKGESVRKYPSLRELAVQRSPEGKPLGFLASSELFATVQRMQRENRIVPLVGNFAGDRTLPELGKLLAAEGRTVRSFYVSNVEQYLMADGLWWKWKRNIAGLPSDDSSVFIRCYLDQGKRHPQQLSGHRTATVLQRIADFNARERPYPSLLALSSDRLVAAR
jgi:hypothetical protein